MKARLAPEYMTREQLWKAVWERVFDLDPDPFVSRRLRPRDTTHRQLRSLLRELEVRGDQLAFGVLDREQEPGDGRVNERTGKEGQCVARISHNA